VAVGADGRVLILTSGSGTGGASNVLLVYDPSPNAAVTLTSLSVTPAAPAAATFPAPSNRPFLSAHGRLASTRDGSLIAGVSAPATGSATVFVYQSSSATVLNARIIANSSTAVSISDDGTRIMSGANLFDAATLRVLAQQSLANSPYPITPGTSFTTAANQGGSAFAPNGQTLYAAYNVVPVQSPAAPTNESQLMLNDPDNLLIQMGIQLPEGLDGKLVISSNGASAYALSDSGFTILATGTISQGPLAEPATTVLQLTSDPCRVTAPTSSATVAINNPGTARITATAQLLTYAGQANQASPATAPQASSTTVSGNPAITFNFNPSAATGLGTISPPHDFLIQSTQAINIPNRIRVYQNSRNSEAPGSVIPIPVGISPTAALADIVYDATRQRVYVANAGLNRVEIYDIAQQALLTPVKVGQLPNSLALTPDGDTLYVANSGGESISIVDPIKLQTIGNVSFAPIAFGSTLAIVTPIAIAAGLSGLQILMSDGSLWEVVGGTALPRGVSAVIGQTAAGTPNKLPITPAPATMVATPGGEYILFATATGIAYLYDGTIDDFVASRQVFTAAAQTGYIGPLAAGPQGQYFLVGGTSLNSALVPTGSRATAGLVSAITPLNSSSYAILSPPAVAGTAEPSAATSIEILNASTGAANVQVNALEGPPTTVAATGRAFVNGRSMVLDATGANAYFISASGLSIISLTPPSAATQPQVNTHGVVNFASLLPQVAPNTLISISGKNLGASATAPTDLLPVVLGGTCVTLNNTPLPLIMTGPTQINAQIPPNLATGNLPLVVRSITNHSASASQTLTVSKYAPAVLVNADGQISLYHADGSYVNQNNPANRDEPLTMFAVGLGSTTGGQVIAGEPSPSNPLAVTNPVSVYFGNPLWVQAAIIVESSNLAPGLIGVYQIGLKVPGFHISGSALPVMIEVGGVKSSTTGPFAPYVAVN